MARKRFGWRRWQVLVSFYAALGAASPAAGVWESPLARVGAAVKRDFSIRVAPGNWGTADVKDIQMILESVAGVVQTFVPLAADGPMAIRVIPRGGAPRVLYQRGSEGEYVVHLTARNELWFQYAYQFSHELCHIASKFDHKERDGDQVATSNQWFEESLCETVSLFALKRMAEVWATNPPAREWTGYAPLFASYAQFLLTQSHRQLATTQSLEQWYRDEQASLRQDPYQRKKNELVANALLPLFESDPKAWRAIAHLNPQPTSAAKEFPAYLRDWYTACPPEDQAVVRQTMALFGFHVPPAEAGEQLVLRR